MYRFIIILTGQTVYNKSLIIIQTEIVTNVRGFLLVLMTLYAEP